MEGAQIITAWKAPKSSLHGRRPIHQCMEGAQFITTWKAPNSYPAPNGAQFITAWKAPNSRPAPNGAQFITAWKAPNSCSYMHSICILAALKVRLAHFYSQLMDYAGIIQEGAQFIFEALLM